MPLPAFKARVDDFIDGVKGAPRRQGVDEVLYPGEKSQRLRRERERAGAVALPESHVKALDAFAAEIGEKPLERRA